MKNQFEAGGVIALDMVAMHGEGTLFKEILDLFDRPTILKEIRENGLDITKKMAQNIYPKDYASHEPRLEKRGMTEDDG